MTTGPGRAPLRRRRDRPRLRQRALPPRVLGLRRVRRRRSRSGRGSRTHIAPQAALLGYEQMLAIARRGAIGLAAVGHHDDGRLQLLGRRGRDAAHRGRAAGDRLPGGVRARARTSQRSGSTKPGRGRRDRCSFGSASRRTLPTPARSTSTRGASRSGSPWARTWPRARARTTGSSDGSGPLSALPALARAADGQRAVGTLEPRPRPGPSLRPLRRPAARRDRPPRGARRSGRPLPAVERAARLRRRPAARIARGGRPGRPRNGLARIDAALRHVRGAAGRDLRRPGP